MNISKGILSASDTKICDLLNLPSTTDKQDMCVASIAFYEGNLSMCDQSGSYKGTCYYDFAANYDFMDLSSCKAAGTDLEGCYRSIAVRTGKVSICSKLSEAASTWCVRDVGISTTNFSICASVVLGNEAYSCFNQATVKKCLDVNQLQTCNLTLADAKEYGAWCDRISNFNCRSRSDSFFYTVAMKYVDSSACSNISEETLRTSCMSKTKGPPA